jgi:hypothetical protein
VVSKILKWQVLRTLKSVLKSESESEIAMCDRMQMYNIAYVTYIYCSYNEADGNYQQQRREHG